MPCLVPPAAPTAPRPTPPRAAAAPAAAVAELERELAGLRQALARRDEFALMLTHELRGPLTAIKGAGATLLRNQGRLDPAVAGQLLRDIDAEVDRLARLLDNLLELSRADDRGDESSRRPTALRPLLARLVATARAGAAGRTLSLRAARDLPPALVDPLRLEQVLRNLLDNAVKYAPADARIGLTARAEAGEVEISVRDSGPALPAEVLARLFDPFYRAPGGRGRPRGSGLGLTICRRLIEAQGGRIWAESPPGGGVVFRLRVPRAPEGAA